MQTRSFNRYYLLNYIFIGSLVLLVINDHFLKHEFANGTTGKLSDIAGIILLPLLLAFLWPKGKHLVLILAAVLFTFWKSPFSQPFIELYNQFAPLETSRVIDYSDLYVLLLLPLPYLLIKNIEQLHFLHLKNIHPILVLCPAAFALMATSPPEKHYYTRTEGNLSCYGCNITLKYSQEQIIQKLQQHGITFDEVRPLDTTITSRFPHLKAESINHYRLNSLILDKDTLRLLDFTMKTIKGKTVLYFNGMNVNQDLSDDRLENQLRKSYKKILFAELKQCLN